MTPQTKATASLLILAGLSLAACRSGEPADRAAPSAVTPVPQSQMSARCIGEAAKKLKRRPQDLQTPLPIEASADGSVVYGQWPAEGDVEGTFECHFDTSGVFVKAHQTSK